MNNKVIISLLMLGTATAALAGEAAATEPISQTQFIHAAESTVNGVVSVKPFSTPVRESRQQQFFNDPFFEYFFGSPRQERQEQPVEPRQTGLGSGVIISTDGYIVTNNHVVEGAERVEVTLNDNRNFEATVVGTDPVTDVALLKIEADSLHAIPVGDSEKLRVGEWVLAVGNPFGFTSTVTSGIVSAKARSISGVNAPRSRGIESFIQTDAALNSGNSGGALVNLAGELVGINTAIYSQTGTYAGCSFAIPTTIVSKVVSDLKTYGMVQRAVLGVSYMELSPELVAQKDIRGTTSGIMLAQIEPGSAADEAGLKENDVIVALGSYPTLSSAQMQEAVSRFSPGDRTEVHYYRDGNRKSAQVTFRNHRGDTSTLTAPAVDLGATFKAIERRTASRLRLSEGIMVSELEPEGRLAAAGVRPGFIIVSVNNTIVPDVATLEALAAAAASAENNNERVLFISGVYPTGKMAYYAVALGE